MLNTEPNIAAPDDFYEALIDMHRDLTEEQSAMVNAKLILLLANQVGDMAVLRQAMAKARDGVGQAAVTQARPPAAPLPASGER